MDQQMDLDTLHYIFYQFCKNLSVEYSEVLTSVTKSLCETTSNNLLKPPALASVKGLLHIYEKLYSTHNETKPHIPINIIISTITNFITCKDSDCNLSDGGVQAHVLSIISSLFKIIFLQNSQENLDKLTEFYISILKSLKKNCKSDCLIFKLKIMISIYDVLTHTPNDEFFKKLKLINDTDECKLIADLVLHQDDSVAIQTLMYLIPKHINCFKSDRILDVTWKQISDSLTLHGKNIYFRVLITQCLFFDIYFERIVIKEKIDLTVLLLEDLNYWKLVQFALVEKDPAKRKQGMYLLKKTLELCKNTSKNFVCGAGDIVFYWNLDCKEKLCNIYSKIILSLEFLEEQQVHIIKPIFTMVEELQNNIIECQKVNFSWILLFYKKALMHESTEVAKWGLSNLLKLPLKFFSSEYIIQEVVFLLVDTLKNISLYYNNGLNITEELSTFLRKMTESNYCKLFFKLFIKNICQQVWSAETLFFVMNSFTGMYTCPFWGKKEISQIEIFVLKAFKTHNKIIRTGIQCVLLNAITLLIDLEEVHLEKIILLISKFSTKDLLIMGDHTWNQLSAWLRKSFTKEEAENVLERYNKGELGDEYDEKFLAVLLILFHNSIFLNDDNSVVVNYVSDIFKSFIDINKRLYCNTTLYDKNLSIICNIYDHQRLYSLITELIKPNLPFAKDIILYVQTQLQQTSTLQDFNACQSYLNSLEILLKTLIAFNIHTEVVKELYVKVSKDFDTCCKSKSSISSIGIYWRIKLIVIVLDTGVFVPEPCFLNLYVLRKANEPLEKDGVDSKTTRDLQTLWGRVNSKFLEAKWKILEYSIKNNLISHGATNTGGIFGVEDDVLMEHCVEALNSGGYEVLCPVMSVLKILLSLLDDHEVLKKAVDLVWKLIMERRKTEEFKSFAKHFVQMLYQENIVKKETSQDILYEYADLIFRDSSLSVVNIFMTHIQQIDLVSCSVPLFCQIVGRGLIFGPVLKKDDRLTKKVCHHIEGLDICTAEKFITSNEIRARAVQMVLALNKNSTAHQNTARDLIKTLIKMENEVNKNRVRYYGNSHVHRVKHRLMQALLLLEPILNPNENEAKNLSSWLERCLLTENSQPSVRQQQEWLLVRILHRHSMLSCTFGIANDVMESAESSKKGVCSLIVVMLHSCKLNRFDPTLQEKIEKALHQMFWFCFHQHFEVRLYAQVAFVNLFDFAQEMKLTKVIDTFKYIHNILSGIFHENLKGNFGKNLKKVSEDFYLTKFHALDHYSLETIYTDFPKLTNVDSDEWISTKLFECCGVNLEKIWISFENCYSALYKTESESVKLSSGEESGLEVNPDEILRNYQKKIIPNKPLIPGCEETRVGQDGLVVVASLIDRIPNLGGLARTCEIFGASEYVVNSLKCVEDKQFTSVSVTSEKWIRMKEVKSHNLLNYISEMKLSGYTVIGAEQALHSVSLSCAKFPKKSLLLLGNEKEGIPPNLLPLLDICVEIPQLGIIRSLNVHVTGALFLWEYAKQNNFL